MRVNEITAYKLPDGSIFERRPEADDHATGLALGRLGMSRDDLARMQADREDDARLALLWLGARVMEADAKSKAQKLADQLTSDLLGHNGGPVFGDDEFGHALKALVTADFIPPITPTETPEQAAEAAAKSLADVMAR